MALTPFNPLGGPAGGYSDRGNPYNRFASPGRFGRTTGIIRGKGKRQEAVMGNLEGRAGSGLAAGTSSTHSGKLYGPRISHIGQGALSSTYLLGDLSKGQTQQAATFKARDIQSRARQTGRPLGYGTTYKFF